MMKEMRTGVFTYNDDSYNFNFKTSLSAYEKMIFVKTVIENIIDGSSYDFVIRDLIFDFAIIELFTNVDTSFINAKDDNGNDINPIIIIEHFLESSNVVDVVKANMEEGLLDTLNRAVDLNVQYLTGAQNNRLNDAIEKLISTFERKISETDLDTMYNMAQKFANMTEDFTVDNVVNAYLDSGEHKANLEEIEEAKKARKTKKK